METSEKCKFCGARAAKTVPKQLDEDRSWVGGYVEFSCGVKFWNDCVNPFYTNQTSKCLIDALKDKLAAANGEVERLRKALDSLPGVEAPAPAAEGQRAERQYDEHGQPVCSHCNAKTNRAYAKHVKLQCWSCGGYLPDLTSRGDAAQHEGESGPAGSE